MDNWDGIVLITGCILIMLLLVMEWRRPSKKRRLLRIGATVIAVCALIALALPLKIRTESPLAKRAVILLTDGFDTDTVSVLLKRSGPDTRVYAADSAAWVQGRNYGAVWMPYPGNWLDGGSLVHIVGTGLSESTARIFTNTMPVLFHAATVPEGITRISWNKELPTGATLRIQGTYSGREKLPVKLLLYGLDAPLDSVLLPAMNAASRSFELSTRPKHSGGAVYRLVALHDKDTLENDPLPVILTPTDTLNVLMLASTPDAENRFIKDWLGAHGSKVSLRTTISKAKYDQAFVNKSSMQVALNEKGLSAYDVVIADAAALQALPPADLSAVATQVQKGMGLIVRTDSGDGGHAFFQQHVSLQSSFAAHQTQIILQTVNHNTAALTAEQALWIRPAAGLQPLLTDVEGHVYAISELYGAGKILTTTLNNTYSWQLSAHTADYDLVWNTLLQKALREKPSSHHWSTQPEFPWPQEKVQVTLESSTAPVNSEASHQNEAAPGSHGQNEAGAKPSSALDKTKNAQSAPALAEGVTTDIQSSPAYSQQIVAPFLWKAATWPRRAGWQYSETGRGRVAAWYVYTPGDWRAARNYNHLQATAAFIRDTDGITQTAIRDNMLVEKPIPAFWFFALFLLCAGFLWVERKL